jgi:hypothetical protein
MYQQRTAWNDFFPNSPTSNFTSQKYTSRQSSSAAAVYVSNSLFINCISGSDGAALYCSSPYLLVESSSFFSCKSSNTWGGAICFYNTDNGQCVLHEVCGYDCCSTNTGESYGQFVYIRVKNDVSSKNYINYSSISRCVSEISNSHYTMLITYGKICCPSVNSSMNKCNYHSGIYCIPFIDSSSITSSLLYSTFADTNAFGYTCIYFNAQGAKYEIKWCNILRNTQDTTSYGTIYTKGILSIDGSCILENTAANIFYSISSSYPITLSNCTVDKTTNNGYLTTQNSFTKSFILGLNHMSTRNCNAAYDSAGKLTVFSYVPQPTKIMFCYYYKCQTNHRQGRVRDFFTVNCLFMITFIQTHPGCDHDK